MLPGNLCLRLEMRLEPPVSSLSALDIDSRQLISLQLHKNFRGRASLLS